MPIENLLTKIIVNTNKLPYEKQKQLLQITQDWLNQAASGNQIVSKDDAVATNTVEAEQSQSSETPFTLKADLSSELYIEPITEPIDTSLEYTNELVSTKDDIVLNVIEERAYERKNVSIPIDFVSSGQLYKEVTKDLSAGGLFIKTKKQSKFKKNQKISMVFLLSENRKPFKLTGKIVRVEAEGIGVQFHNISPFECVSIEEELGNSTVDYQ